MSNCTIFDLSKYTALEGGRFKVIYKQKEIQIWD
jgi:hypothetical protein